MSGRSREMKWCGVGVEEGCSTVQSVIIKVPLQNYCCWVWCGQQSDFPRHTYLLLCEEDVSVAQLKKKNYRYHLNSDSSPAWTINHFLTTSQLKGFCPRRRINWREQGVPTEIPDNEISVLPYGKCSWMCIFWGIGGDHWRPGMAGELNYIKFTEFLEW